jgi:hypothetical protein
MTDHEEDRHLDELLDSALSAYSAVEPRPGLETRIIAQVRDAARPAGSPGWNWRWLWAGAVAAAAILLLALWTNRQSQTPWPRKDVVRNSQPPVQSAPKAESSTPAAAALPNHRSKFPRQAHSQTVTWNLQRRPEIFPTPMPLSEQEKLLLSYYARTPREELIAQSHPDEAPVTGQDQSEVNVPDLIFVPQKSSNTR